MIKEILQPRPEVLSGRLHGVIDLERVSDSKKKALESRAKEFFDSIFVSGELRRLIEGLHHRLESDEGVVRYRALSIDNDEAWERITDWWRTEILRDREAVFFATPA